MGRKKLSSELTIMSLWPTLSDEGKRIIGDWIASQMKEAAVKPRRSDAGKPRRPAQSHLNPPAKEGNNPASEAAP